jgi:hypothetical protein
MLRKFIFSFVAVIVGPFGSDIQSFCGLAVLVCFLQLQTSLNPYESPKLNLVETLGLLARFTTILFGLALSSPNSSATTDIVLGSLIVVINVLFILWCTRIFYRAFQSIRKDGILVSLGFRSNVSKDGKVQDANNGDSSPGNKQSVALSVHDLFPEKPGSQSDAFENQFTQENDTESYNDGRGRLSSGNPVFVNERHLT